MGNSNRFMREQDYRNNGWSRMTLINEITKAWEMINLKFGGHILKQIPWRKIMSIRVDKLTIFKNMTEKYGTVISKTTKGWQKNISPITPFYSRLNPTALTSIVMKDQVKFLIYSR